jgi:competence protein ComEC
MSDPSGAGMNRIFRLPLLPVFGAYTLGIYVGQFDPSFPSQGFIILFLLLLSGWTISLLLRKVMRNSWILLFLFFVLGTFSIRTYLHPPLSSSEISQFIGDDPIAVEGVIDRSPDRFPGGKRLSVQSQKVILSHRQIAVAGRILLFLREENVSLHMGDRIRVLCKLRFPRGFHNPGGFDYERYLAFERIHAIGFLSVGKGWVKLGGGFKNPILLQIEDWRDRIREFLTTETAPLCSGIFKALVLGEQEDIPEEVREHFVRTGIAHLLAISGDHLGIVARLSYSLLIWLLKRSETVLLSTSVKKWAAALTLPCILLYTLIAGGGISVVRATIMVILFLFSILFQRERNLLHTLAVAAFLILIFSPPSLFDVSFQLSFIAVLSILYLVPRLLPELKAEEPLAPHDLSLREKFRRYVKTSLLVSAVASFGTAPFVALHFNRVSPIGLVTNLLFVPWVGFLIVPLTIVASLLSFFFHPLAVALIHVNEFLTMALLESVAFFASFSFASLFVSTPTVFEVVLFCSLLFLIGHLRKGRAIRYLFSGLIIVLIFDVAYWNLKGLFEKDLSVTFLDVGHGDSILVEFPGGKRMLIDGGGLHDDRFDIGRSVIAPFLWKKKIRKIDTLVLTHPDPDHFKGLHFIASRFRIGHFWDNGFQTDSEVYLRLKTTILERRIEWFSCNEKTPLQIIKGVQISFLNPEMKTFPPRSRKARDKNPVSLNNHSLVIRLQFKNVVFLLAADIEKETEERLVKRECLLKADILKIPHHGSASSSTPFFIRKVGPTYAILSVGEQNIGKLPHQEILKRYEELGTRVFRTDRHGAITVITNGEKIEVKTFLKKDRFR